MAAQALGASSREGFSPQAGDAYDVPLAGRVDGRAALEVDLRRIDLHQGGHAARVPVADLDHAAHAGPPG